MNALDYLLKANLYAGLFAGCYWLLLRRHTFFGVNRAYLLASVVLSLTLPLASLPTQTLDALPATLTTPVGVIALPAVTVSATVPDNLAIPTADSLPIAARFDWLVLASWLYGAVAMLLLMRLGWHMTKLLRIINASARKQHDGYVLVQPNNANTPTFSFFRYLVLNPADADNTLILRHELVHIRQYHSADVLVLATLRAVFWACPALWLLERAVRETHEFLADRVAIRQLPDQPARQGAEQYARFLVDYAFGVRPDVLTNGFFNPSLLKRRIQMMQQRTTTRWAFGKYVLVLPLAFALLAMTTAREKVAAVFEKTVTVSGRVTSAADGKPLPGVTIVVKGKTQGTTTNADGNYRLTLPEENESLVFSFIGFATKEVEIAGKSVVNVSLQKSPNRLNELVITAYEARDKAPSATTTQPTSFSGKPVGVFTVVEQNPEFPGGMTKLGEYLGKNIRYPAKAQRERISGTVLIHFTVATDGSIDDVYVGKGIGGGCNEEAIRLIEQMPRWQPGRQAGKPVAVPYELPIEFKLEQTDKRTGHYEPTFKPLGTPVADFPTAHSGEFPERVMTVDNITVPAESIPKPSISLNRYLTSFGYDLTGMFDSIPTGKAGSPIRWSWSRVSIRANGPLGPLGDDQQPLIILDGLEIDKVEMDQLNPKAIQSIEVLKKSSASAMYGEKGKNGVVIITTKKP